VKSKGLEAPFLSLGWIFWTKVASLCIRFCYRKRRGYGYF